MSRWWWNLTFIPKLFFIILITMLFLQISILIKPSIKTLLILVLLIGINIIFFNVTSILLFYLSERLRYIIFIFRASFFSLIVMNILLPLIWMLLLIDVYMSILQKFLIISYLYIRWSWFLRRPWNWETFYFFILWFCINYTWFLLLLCFELCGLRVFCLYSIHFGINLLLFTILIAILLLY